MEVRRAVLGDDGGSVEMRIDPAGYVDLESWTRICVWDEACTLEISDEVHLKSPAVALFRFHLGQPSAIESRQARTIGVKCGNASISIEASRPITAELTEWPGPSDRIGNHQCLVIRTEENVGDLSLTCRVAG